MSERERTLTALVKVLVDELSVCAAFFEGYLDEVGDADDESLAWMRRAVELERDVIGMSRALLARNIA